MRVLKFGGSSLADSAAIQRVAQIVREHAEIDTAAVVCSACGGVTNQLLRIVELARANRRDVALAELESLTSRHRQLILDLDLVSSDHTVPTTVEKLLVALRECVAAANPEAANAAWTDYVLSFGERLSVRIVAAALGTFGVNADPVDASDFLVTTGEFQNAAPLMDETFWRAQRFFQPIFARGAVPVVTGFIGSARNGAITTLGRNSSDYSAAIVAQLLGASELSIFTDVDGVFDNDPRETSGRKEIERPPTFLERLSYEEALHLANRGARVLHPKTISPLRERNIALRIRNTFRLEHAGTRIGPSVTVNQDEQTAALQESCL
jgi:aspartate kinase